MLWIYIQFYCDVIGVILHGVFVINMSNIFFLLVSLILKILLNYY